MSFYSRGGIAATGTKEEAFKKAEFALIPHNTWVHAKIIDFKLKSQPWNLNEFAYKIVWQVISGPYKDRRLFQDLRCFDNNDQIAMIALNQLVYLAKLFDVWLPEEAQPQNNDLLPFIHQQADLKIIQSKPKEDKPEAKINNYIGEVEEHKPERFGEISSVEPEVPQFNDDIGF